MNSSRSQNSPLNVEQHHTFYTALYQTKNYFFPLKKSRDTQGKNIFRILWSLLHFRIHLRAIYKLLNAFI